MPSKRGKIKGRKAKEEEKRESENKNEDCCVTFKPKN